MVKSGIEGRRSPSAGSDLAVASATVIRSVLDEMERSPFLTREKTGAYLVLRFYGMKEEYGMALFFSKNGTLLGECPLQDGKYVFSNKFYDIILDSASRLGAASFILAHNHVTGRPTPSSADAATTASVERYFEGREVVYADHFIVSGADYTTMKTDGYWKKRYDGKSLEIR